MSLYLRRKTLILILIFVLIAFAYVRKEIFFQQAKRLIEQNLAKGLQCQLSIEKIKPGILGGLVLESLKIAPAPDSDFNYNIKLKRAYVDYNLWEALFSSAVRTKRRFASSDLRLELESGEIYFGKTKTAFLSDIEGKLLISKDGLYFQDIAARLKDTLKPALKINGKLSDTSLAVTANIDHLKLGDNFDLLSNLALTLERNTDIQTNSRKISGTLKTYGSVFNNQPFPELNSSFEVQNDRLRILTASLGSNYDLRGIVNLQPPFEADLSLNFYQAALNELISCFKFSEEPNLSGTLNGLVEITGPLSQPKIEGYLEAKQGHIGDLTFASANVNIKGRYPKISIVDSRILREEDSFLVEGELDLVNLEKSNGLDIELKPDKGMFWQGWDITRQENNQVRMSKNIDDDFKLTFDAFMEEELSGFSDDDSKNELGLTYRILGDKLIKLRLKKEEEILGIEQRVRF